MNIIKATEWLWNKEPEGREDNYLKEILKQYGENNGKNRETTSDIQDPEGSIRSFQEKISKHNE